MGGLPGGPGPSPKSGSAMKHRKWMWRQVVENLGSFAQLSVIFFYVVVIARLHLVSK